MLLLIVLFTTIVISGAWLSYLLIANPYDVGANLSQISNAGVNEKTLNGLKKSQTAAGGFKRSFKLHSYNGDIFHRSPHYSEEFNTCLDLAEFLINSTEFVNLFVYYHDYYQQHKYPTIKEIYTRMDNPTDIEKKEAMKHLQSQTIEIGISPLCWISQTNISSIQCFNSISQYAVTTTTSPLQANKSENVHVSTICLNNYYYTQLSIVQASRKNSLIFYVAWCIIYQTYHYKQIEFLYEFNEKDYFDPFLIDKNLQRSNRQGHVDHDIDEAYFGQYFTHDEQSKACYSLVFHSEIQAIEILCDCDDKNKSYYSNIVQIYFVSKDWIDAIFEFFDKNESFEMRSIYKKISYFDNCHDQPFVKDLTHNTIDKSKYGKYYDYCFNSVNVTCSFHYVTKTNYDPCHDRFRVQYGRSMCPDVYFVANLNLDIKRKVCKEVFDQRTAMSQGAIFTYNACQNISINGTNYIFVYEQ